MSRRARSLGGRLAVGAVAGVLAAAASANGAVQAGAPAGAVTKVIRIQAASSPVVAGGQVWILHAGRPVGRRPAPMSIVRVSPRTNRVVGRPVGFPGENAYQLKAAGGRLWAFGGATVYRVDPQRGAITGTIALGRGANATDLDVARGVLWVLRGGSSPRLDRYDARTLRRCAARCARFSPGTLPADGVAVQVRPQGAYITSFDPFRGPPTLVRLGAAGGRRGQVVLAGEGPVFAGGRAWVGVGEGITRIDPETLVYDPRVVRFTGRRVTHLTAGDGALWVAASAFAERRNAPPRLRDHALYRIDPASGQRAGDPVRLPAAPLWLTAGAGSVWVVTGDALLRIRPARPRPALVAEPAPASPPVLLSGPLGPGTYLAPASFGLPLTVTLPDGGWLFSPAYGASGSLGAEVLQFQRADAPGSSLLVTLPTGVYGPAGTVPAASPADALAAWQANPRLRVTNVAATTVAGRPATVADVAPAARTSPRVIALTGDFISVEDDGAGDLPVRMLLTQSASGRLVVVVISRGAHDPLAPAQAVVDGLGLPPAGG